jgi:glycosyltransferase involved in cell wall biosynthesis
MFLDMKNIKMKKNRAIVKQTSNIQQTWDFLRNQGKIDLNRPRFIPGAPWVHGFWKNEPCYIVAAGPSLKGFDFKLLDNKHTIGMNHMIETYDKFEWFIFLDQRFLDITTYDMKKFKGHVFAQNTTELNPAENITLFKCKNDGVSYNFDDGLFKSALTALVALNLAILSGANPIYLLGCDCGGAIDGDKQYHYRADYTGEDKNLFRYRKYQRTAYFFDNFSQWKDRIINLSAISEIKTFKKQSWKSHFAKPEIQTQGRLPSIAHMSFTGDVTFMGDFSRHIIRSCYGRHSLHRFNETPEADLYILEHFQSTRREVENFQYKNKAIDLVHTVGCSPKGDFKKVIALTKTWKKILAKEGINSQVIYGGIDIGEYTHRASFENKTFGRITRWSTGKIHPEWNRIVKKIIDTDKQYKNIMYVHFLETKNRPPLYHDQIKYNESVKIFEYKGQYLWNLSVYIHANHTFLEICSHALIEAMATGLPIVLLYEESSAEVLGEAGIICQSIDEVRDKTLQLLQDKDMWNEYSQKSLNRAKFFTHTKMIEEWDKVIKECLKK